MLVTKVKTFNISSDNQPGFFIVKVETDEGIYGLGEIGIRNWSGSIQYAIDQDWSEVEVPAKATA